MDHAQVRQTPEEIDNSGINGFLFPKKSNIADIFTKDCVAIKAPWVLNTEAENETSTESRDDGTWIAFYPGERGGSSEESNSEVGAQSPADLYWIRVETNPEKPSTVGLVADTLGRAEATDDTEAVGGDAFDVGEQPDPDSTQEPPLFGDSRNPPGSEAAKKHLKTNKNNLRGYGADVASYQTNVSPANTRLSVNNSENSEQLRGMARGVDCDTVDAVNEYRGDGVLGFNGEVMKLSPDTS